MNITKKIFSIECRQMFFCFKTKKGVILVEPGKIVSVNGILTRYLREEEEYIVSDGLKQIPIKWTAPEALNYGK